MNLEQHTVATGAESYIAPRNLLRTENDVRYLQELYDRIGLHLFNDTSSMTY